MTQSTEIRYSSSKETPISDLRTLYLEAGWIDDDFSNLTLETMVRNSFAVSAAYSGERLVGFMRAFSDGVSDAYLLDLIVEREFRGRGIGQVVFERLAAFVRSCGVDWIVCVGARGTKKFYGAVAGVEILDDYVPYRWII